MSEAAWPCNAGWPCAVAFDRNAVIVQRIGLGGFTQRLEIEFETNDLIFGDFVLDDILVEGMTLEGLESPYYDLTGEP